MMLILLASVLAVFATGLAPQQDDPPPPTPASTYADEVRCTGVLYSYQQRLKQNDPRQIAIRGALSAFNDRLERRVSSGEVEEAAIAMALQEAVNVAATAPIDAIEGCIASPSPELGQ